MWSKLLAPEGLPHLLGQDARWSWIGSRSNSTSASCSSWGYSPTYFGKIWWSLMLPKMYVSVDLLLKSLCRSYLSSSTWATFPISRIWSRGSTTTTITCLTPEASLRSLGPALGSSLDRIVGAFHLHLWGSVHKPEVARSQVARSSSWIPEVLHNSEDATSFSQVAMYVWICWIDWVPLVSGQSCDICADFFEWIDHPSRSHIPK